MGAAASHAILVTLTLLWFLTVGGALIASQNRGRMGGLAVAFGVRFVVGVLCWDTVVAALAGAGRRWMGPRTLRALNGIAGLVFFGFALRLAWKFLQTPAEAPQITVPLGTTVSLGMMTMPSRM